VIDVIILRGLNGFVSATFWVSASTLTADISPLPELTRSMGRYNLAWITGFTVGPYLGGIISNKFGFNIFFISLGFCVFMSSIIILLKIYPKIKLPPVSKTGKPSFRSLEGLIVAYLTLLPFAMILGIYMAIIPGHMSTVGLVASTIGLLLTLTNGVRGINFLNVERYVSWGTRKSLFLASFILIVSMYLMQFAKTMTSFLVPLILYGFSAGIITPVALDFITKRTPKEALGSAMGVHEGVYGLGMTFGPIIGGSIAEIYDPNILYLLLAFLAMTIIPLTINLTSKKPWNL
jgi:MFS family permease